MGHGTILESLVLAVRFMDMKELKWYSASSDLIQELMVTRFNRGADSDDQKTSASRTHGSFKHLREIESANAASQSQKSKPKLERSFSGRKG